LVSTLSGTVIPIIFSLEQIATGEEVPNATYLKNVLEVTDGVIKLAELAGKEKTEQVR
jgi:hypothetical protein